MTLDFALRGDMGWVMAGAYWVVQFAAAAAGSLVALAFFGTVGNLAATRLQPRDCQVPLVEVSKPEVRLLNDLRTLEKWIK